MVERISRNKLNKMKIEQSIKQIMEKKERISFDI